MKIVCIGNSNVNGFPHRRSRCWVSLLRERTGHAIINKGINGDTTAGILSRFENDALRFKPARIVILSGTNDFIFLDLTPEEAMENLRKMAQMAGTVGAGVLFLTPCLTDPEGAQRCWKADTDYEQVNRKLSGLRALLLSYGEASGTQGSVYDLQADYPHGFVDGIHLTEAGHAWLADRLQGVFQEAP